MSQLKTSVPERTERPHGQPGEVRTGYRRRDGLEGRWGLTYPAVKLPSDVVLFWRDTESAAPHWIVAPAKLAETFEAGPEWQARCEHMHQGLPYRWCTTEAECIALDRENERRWGR